MGSLQEVQCKRHVFQIHSLLDKFVMLMLSYNINSMLCRSFPSVWQVPPIRVKLPCVRVRAFLIMKILPWSSLVFFCCCSCILPTSGLARNINNVNSSKELFQFSAHNMPKKLQSGKILQMRNVNPFCIFSYLLVVLHLCPLLLFFTVPVAFSFPKMLRLGWS